jgi:hypothetical protein
MVSVTKGAGLMDGGLVEMCPGGEGLEHLGVHPPAAATETTMPYFFLDKAYRI